MMLENVKKFISISLVLPSLAFCASSDDDVPYIVYAKEIMNPFIKQSEKEYKLDCIGTGGGFARNVREIGIKFIAYRRGSIEEAREMEVKMMETLLTQVNAHEKIRPYLVQYPFKPENTAISIAFRKRNNERYADGSVAYISLGKNNMLHYFSENPKDGILVDFFQEPYEEALKIVNSTLVKIKNDGTKL